MRRLLWVLLVLPAGCRPDSGPPVRQQEEVQASEAAPGPPLAKNDPRFKPYVPKAPASVDYSAFDVGEAPMDGAAESLDALGTALVEALRHEDAESLEALAIDEHEYTERFFPLTVNHPSGLGLGAALAWAELHGESRGDMQTALVRYGGQPLAFVRLEVGASEPRGQVVLHRRPVLVVADEQGDERELVMLGSILEHEPSGGFKVLAYRDTR